MKILEIIRKSNLLAKFDAAVADRSVINMDTGKVDMRSVKSLAVTAATVKGSDGNSYPLMAVLVKIGGGNPVTDDLRTCDAAVAAGKVMRDYLKSERPAAGWVNLNQTERSNPKAAFANLDEVTF